MTLRCLTPLSRWGLKEKPAKILVGSERLRDPQTLVLAPDSAVRIAEEIVSHKSYTKRIVAAASKALEIIRENQGKLALPMSEKRYVSRFQEIMEGLKEKGS